MSNIISYERYQRQIILKEFGEVAQQKLAESKVLVLGAGGLGCAALQYLTAAGVGTIGIVDDDVVSLNNLQRQVLYSVDDIGKPKAERAASRLRTSNSEIDIVPYLIRLNAQNTLDVLARFDIIIDGTDNFATRYMINDACVLLNKPLVYGAISQYEGQVAIFNFRENQKDSAANYRDLFPQPLADDEVLNCEQAGVLGVLPGIIGTMMANETIKMITGIGKRLVNELVTYNVLNNEFYQVHLPMRKETASLIPQTEAGFMQTNYESLCASLGRFEIDPHRFNELAGSGRVNFIDVREPGEEPEITEFVHEKVPFSKLHETLTRIEGDTIVLFCQTGTRSLRAAQLLFNKFGETKNIYSLRGGILSWKKMQSKQPA